MNTQTSNNFRPVPKTGVIYVMTEAAKHGYTPDSPNWANLGQGAPEVGELEGAPPRMTSFSWSINDLEYGPVIGLPELREAVADLYNERYRVGSKSKYTKDNVAICSGGRLALTRLVSTLGKSNVGHFLPDYTAYEELLDAFGTFNPIPIPLSPEQAYQLSGERIEQEIVGRGLSSLIISNPNNPTGQLIAGETLEQWISVGRETKCALIFDEFYSHYLYDSEAISHSAAAYVEDVNADDVVILDGLTKNWRYPGFRVAWTIGPEAVIERLASAGSFLDGGCARPIQVAAASLVTKEIATQEAKAIQKNFSQKREFMVRELRELGIAVDNPPQGAFYCWGNLKGLPEEVNTGMKLFQKGLEEQVIVVPGHFFDINPGGRRPLGRGKYDQYARFSFGPSMEELQRGIENLRRVINAAS
ncbi:pyridoxal phosphate-dependent aminotransferase [bacterium]|nr:MAG: pyridoxal phosphate-dependent aminotransferase [bacterium]